MKKAKLFIDNFIVYGLGGIISKMIPFFMMPIVTRLMPDSSFIGIADLSATIVAFGAAVATMGLYDAMYRLSFDKGDPDIKGKMVSTAVFFTYITSFAIAVVILLSNNLVAGLFNSENYSFEIVIITAASIMVSTVYPFLLSPIRMVNNRKMYVLINLLYAVINYGLIMALIYCHLYLIAMPLAYFVSGLLMMVWLRHINKEWISIRKVDYESLKKMLRIGLPMMPNFVFYWLMHSCDRIMISSMLGAKYNGVYSVAAKYGGISQLIYIAFAGGWHYFAFSTMDDEDQVKTVSLIFEYLGVASLVCTMLVCLIVKPFWRGLFEVEYYDGYLLLPYLFLSPLLLMLFQAIGNQYLIIKKTGPTAIFLLLGAIANIVCNRVLIPTCGMEGAAIATLLGYLCALFLCAFFLHMSKLFFVSKRFLICAITFLTFFLFWRLLGQEHFYINFLYGICFLFFVLCSYRKEISLVMTYIRNVFRKGDYNANENSKLF